MPLDSREHGALGGETVTNRLLGRDMQPEKKVSRETYTCT